MALRTDQQLSLRRELVGVAEVATRLRLTAERVRQLAKGDMMPEPVGELGRRLIWDWRDVEAWARSEGRLDPSGGESRQFTQPWRQRPRGALRLVVDEILKWGQREIDLCHVRVWAPPAGSNEAQIVLLGQLQDEVNSVTNNVETVAMTVAGRYLGPSWRVGQVYQYNPATLIDDGDVYLHVTFTIRTAGRGRRKTIPGSRSTLVRTLGAELSDPAWHVTSVDELEHLTGHSPRTWAPGTYTHALVECAKAADRQLEVMWDPEQAQALSRLAADLGDPQKTDTGALKLRLSEPQCSAVRSLLVDAAVNAFETARQDVSTQPIDAVVTLQPARLDAEAQLFAWTRRNPVGSVDPYVLWEALTALRQGLMDNRFQDDPLLKRERQLLVRGLHGGWVPLHWADAGVEEQASPRHGWWGPIALPEDVIGQEHPPATADQAQLTVLLLDTIAAYLAETWDDWSRYDMPDERPSTVLAATGPLSRAYLDQFTWQLAQSGDPARLQRLPNRDELDRVTIDHDGWLVARPKSGEWFVCEWPVSGAPDHALAGCEIRADRSEASGATPVFLIDPDGKLRLLPSAGQRHHGNSFAWGYGGGGPWDFSAAIADLLARAAGSTADSFTSEAHALSGELVASPRTPSWRVSDLLAQIPNPGPPYRAVKPVLGQ